MSASKVRKFSQVLGFTATWAAGVLTITTAAAVLVTGDIVALSSEDSPQHLRGAVTVVSATSFTMVADATYSTFLKGQVTIGFFRTGFVGNVWLTSPNSAGLPGVVQAVVTGTGGATTAINGSLNGVNFGAALATLTNTITSGDSQSMTVAANWAWISASISVIGAATKLEIWYSA